MTAPFPFQRLILGLLIVLVGSASIAHARVKIESGFQPSTLQVGRTGEFKITLQGTHNQAQGTIPTVEGLEFISSGQQRSFNMTNNHMVSTLTYTFKVRALQPGQYTLPSFELKVGQETLTIPEHTLEVVPRSDDETDQLMLELTLPRETFYVGETVPFDVTLLAAETVRGQLLQPAPVQVGEAFTMADFAIQPTREYTHKAGRPFQAISWPSALTMLKSGEHELSFEMNLAVASDDSQQARRSRNMSPLFDSFFDSMFRQHDEVRLTTPPLNVNVIPLPDKGKPEGFTGAIGLFSITEPTPVSPVARVGEPLTIKVEISGEGNFSRLTPPSLNHDTTWRSYTPKMEFIGRDPRKFEGKQVIEYVIIPREAGLQPLPKVRFSYFNPETQEYIVLSPDSGRTIEVLPAPPGIAPSVIATSEPPPSVETGNEILPIMLHLGRCSSARVPWLRQPVFWALQLLPALIITALLVIRRRQWRLEHDHAYALREKARKALQIAHEALLQAHRQNNDSAFMSHLAETLRWWVVLKLERQNGDSLTTHEIIALLEKANAPAEIKKPARQVLEAMEAWRYAGRTDTLPERVTLLEAVNTLITHNFST
jgi:hypothetical protein